MRGDIPVPGVPAPEPAGFRKESQNAAAGVRGALRRAGAAADRDAVPRKDHFTALPACRGGTRGAISRIAETIALPGREGTRQAADTA